MKISRLSLLAVIPALMLFLATPSSAQAPDGQLGIQAGTHGLGIQYALSPSVHIGAVVNMRQGDVNPSQIIIAPYGKFLFEGDVNPYIKGSLVLNSQSPDVGSSSSSTALVFAFGLEYFITESVGVFGDATIFELGLDPSYTIFGIVGGSAGVEWFFN